MQEELMGITSEQDELMALCQSDKDIPAGMWHFVRDNFGIVRRFFAEADKIRAAGRRHYSARTIGEFLRHETALREGGTFKCNDHRWPGLARIYMAARDCSGFFELRGKAN